MNSPSKPKVSVIMAVYDGATYLREAVDSILAQTFADFEFIIIDDASMDETPAILASYTDRRMRVIRNEQNLGLAASLNRALDVANGDYVARMDADDVSLPNRLARQVAFLDAHSDIAAVGSYARTMGTGIILRHPTDPRDIAVNLLFRTSLLHPTVVFRRDFLEAHRFRYDPAFRQTQDYELFTRMAPHGRFANIPSVLLSYRQHGDQASEKHRERQKEYARAIVERQSRLLGLEPTAEDVEVIAALKYHELATIPDPLSRVDELFRKIEAAASGTYDRSALRRVLGTLWIETATSLSRSGVEVRRDFLLKRRALCTAFSLRNLVRTFRLLLSSPKKTQVPYRLSVSGTKMLMHNLLKKAERYAKTDLRYVIKNTFWLGVSQVGIAFLALLLSVAFARYVPKDVYGSYRYLLSVFWTLTSFTLTGLPIALARAISKGEDGAYPASVRLSLLWSAPMVLISLGLAVYYFAHGNTMLFVGSLIIAGVGPFLQPTFLFGSFLEGKRAFRTNALSGILLNTVPTVALLAAMFLTVNPLWFLAIYLLGNVGTAAAISAFVWKRYRDEKLAPSESLFSLGAHFSAMNVLAGIAQQIDRLLVFHYLGPVELATYSFAVAMPDQIKGMASNVANIAFPKFANRPLHEIKRTLTFRMEGFTIIMMAVVAAYVLLAHFFFSLLFPAYLDAVFYSQVYALGLIPLASIFPPTVLQSHGASKELYAFSIISSAFQIGILFPAIAYFGLLGVVVSRVISRVLGFIFSVILIQQYAKRVT